MANAAAEMDAIYRVQRHIYDASRKYYLLGRDGLIDTLDVPTGGSILEIGCGTGRNLILAARRYPSARLFGIDVSHAMLETASASVARAGLGHRIMLAQADASCLDAQALFGVAGFDRVFVSYALSMIPPWREALVCAFEAVRPGGALHIVDFGEQSGLPSAFRTGLRAWLRKFSVEPRAELEEALRALAGETGAALTFERPFRDYACRVVLRKPSS
ncbi:class I SAM-dependent methyltransferase [Hyphomicrobium sp.]|uniref:class I SAM-dependent methyltransferase n=1 Tax=Hyphomicrobium sp. TaxID=82 RepID=UPI0025C5D6F8|nr:class I SAM-dependent methyltransferase [Hyphomicrobium sp.]MCC7252269.1 class I SAM-dependent methyltransferase [Hyphomicrobium sp.]